MHQELIDWRAGAKVSNSTLRAVVGTAARTHPAMVERRTKELMSRSLKKSTQADRLDLAVQMIDLTSLEGLDTERRVARLVAKALTPDQHDVTCPQVAAVCVEPDRVIAAKEAIAAHSQHNEQALFLNIASVAWAFPAGRTNRESGVLEIKRAVKDGASEIDIVIDRAKLVSGDWAGLVDDVRAAKKACGSAHLKVILETSELGTYTNIVTGSWLAVIGGADFIKTSTGKLAVGATPQAVLLMARVARDASELLATPVGIKAAGGISSAQTALRYINLVAEECGTAWLTPDLFRLGASSLLNDVVAQRAHAQTGVYYDSDTFSLA